MTALGHRQKVVRRRGGLDRVHGDLHVAVGAVLEPDGTRQSGRELAVNLAFRRAGADRAPGDEVGDVLRRDHVEVFGPRGQIELVDLEQDAPCEAQPFVDAKAVVETGIVDEPFPADGRARFLEVDAHHDDEAVGELLLDRGQARRVVDRSVVVVDRAGSHHDQQTVVGAVQHAVDRLPGFECGGRGTLGRRELAQQMCGRRQLGDVGDPGVVDRVGGARRGACPGLVAMRCGGRHGHGSLNKFTPKQHITAYWYRRVRGGAASCCSAGWRACNSPGGAVRETVASARCGYRRLAFEGSTAQVRATRS